MINFKFLCRKYLLLRSEVANELYTQIFVVPEVAMATNFTHKYLLYLKCPRENPKSCLTPRQSHKGHKDSNDDLV